MMRARYLIFPLLWLLTVAPAAAEDYFDPYYPGSEAVADGKGRVHVKVSFFATDSCWQIAKAREGVPDVASDQPTGRDLYVTVDVAHGGGECQPTATPLKTIIDIPDQKGKLSLDIFFVDQRGVLIRSQRHRIQRDVCPC